MNYITQKYFLILTYRIMVNLWGFFILFTFFYKQNILLFNFNSIFISSCFTWALIKSMPFDGLFVYILFGISQFLCTCFQFYYFMEHFNLPISVSLLYHHNSNIGSTWRSHSTICYFPWLLNTWQLNSLCVCNPGLWDYMRLVLKL